jgi:hypothetical protein
LIFLEISEIFRIFLEFFLELLKKKLISFKKFFEVGIFLDFLLSIQPAIVRWLWVVFYLLFWLHLVAGLIFVVCSSDLIGDENGSRKRFQRVEILKIAEPCPLIDPSQVVVTQGEILVADPVLTPIGTTVQAWNHT